MTIVVGGSNIDPNLLSKMEVFIKKMCSWPLCIRRGSHYFISSYENGCQTSYFKFENVEQGSQRVVWWDVPKKALDEHVVHCKQFQNIALHTFVGMVCNCMKDIDENHF
jgi:hypothetical protein